MHRHKPKQHSFMKRFTVFTQDWPRMGPPYPIPVKTSPNSGLCNIHLCFVSEFICTGISPNNILSWKDSLYSPKIDLGWDPCPIPAKKSPNSGLCLCCPLDHILISEKFMHIEVSRWPSLQSRQPHALPCTVRSYNTCDCGIPRHWALGLLGRICYTISIRRKHLIY